MSDNILSREQWQNALAAYGSTANSSGACPGSVDLKQHENYLWEKLAAHEAAMRADVAELTVAIETIGRLRTALIGSVEFLQGIREGFIADRKKLAVEITTKVIIECQEALADLPDTSHHIDRIKEALTKSLWHVEELTEAFREGRIGSHDGKNGERSNRNHDIEILIRKALADTPPVCKDSLHTQPSDALSAPTEPTNGSDNKTAIKLISDRIRKMREVYTSEPGGDKEELWMGHAFHLMEIRQILEGQYTCGVYDDFGAPEGKFAGDSRVVPPCPDPAKESNEK